MPPHRCQELLIVNNGKLTSLGPNGMSVYEGRLDPFLKQRELCTHLPANPIYSAIRDLAKRRAIHDETARGFDK